jgi:hypothetical protein
MGVKRRGGMVFIGISSLLCRAIRLNNIGAFGALP